MRLGYHPALPGLRFLLEIAALACFAHWAWEAAGSGPPRRWWSRWSGGFAAVAAHGPAAPVPAEAWGPSRGAGSVSMHGEPVIHPFR